MNQTPPLSLSLLSLSKQMRRGRDPAKSINLFTDKRIPATCSPPAWFTAWIASGRRPSRRRQSAGWPRPKRPSWATAAAPAPAPAGLLRRRRLPRAGPSRLRNRGTALWPGDKLGRKEKKGGGRQGRRWSMITSTNEQKINKKSEHIPINKNI